MSSIDVLLDGPRAQRAFLLKAVFSGEWSISVEDQAPLTVVAVVAGAAVFTWSSGCETVTAGDVIVCRGPAPYTFADAADRPTDIRILPGQVCVDTNNRILPDDMFLGVRTWGNTRAEADATVMLIGTYERATSVGSLVLAHQPTGCVLRGFETPVVDLLAAELTDNAPGQSTVLDRLLDVLTAKTIRATATPSPSRDHEVSTALRSMEAHPDHPWTVASLAHHVGLSRAAFARRFTAQVGEPPLSYLTRWRLSLAADLLLGTELPLAAIATRVGYGSAFAFSAAFKRSEGRSPQAFRAAHAHAHAHDETPPTLVSVG